MVRVRTAGGFLPSTFVSAADSAGPVFAVDVASRLLAVRLDAQDLACQPQRIFWGFRRATGPWFIYLFRSDVREGRRIDDPEAQRDFTAWWLTSAKAEYPLVWGVTSEILATAMEPVTTPAGEMPRLLWWIWRTRPDIQQSFPLGHPELLSEYLCWYRVEGCRHVAYAPPLPEPFLAETECLSQRVPDSHIHRIPRLAVVLAHMLPSLRSLLDLSVPASREWLAKWYRETGHKLLPAPAPMPGPPTSIDRKRKRQPRKITGINLVGFARSEFGLGEDIRMAAKVLDALGIPHVIINIAPGAASTRQQDDTVVDRIVEELVHPVTILCMSPFDAVTLWLREGQRIFDDRYIIGYWPWELERFPDIWHDAVELVDEIWAPSQFTAASFRAQDRRPVWWMPLAVELPPIPKLSRRQLGLPIGKYLFVYPFDPNSYIARKNPSAAVKAFRLAFPRERSVRLILRVNGPTGCPGWDEVEAAIAGDNRIIVMQGTYERAKAYAIVGACDCLVSLHRSEGFGRNIAEAQLLGLQVIATGYSGCTDFLEPDDSVRWIPRPVGEDYPFGEGLFWADPDIGDAARMMREAFETRGQRDPATKAARLNVARVSFSVERISGLWSEALFQRKS